uniref:GTP cyclohydrolase folE2 n=1 Tax=Lygus hesperus TaxID=30085 RepID=A0A0A9XWC2_LYGHE
MKWSALVLVVYLGLPFCLSLVKRIRPQEYLAIQSSCEKWFVIFINSWCWNTLLIDDFVFRLRSLLYNLEGVANIGVIDGMADAGFYNLFGYGSMQFVQLIDPPCSNVALLKNPNVRNLLPYFDPQKITKELISLVGVYEQDGCKLQGDFKFAFVPTNQQIPGCMVSVYGLNKEQPARFNFVSNGMAALYGVPSFLDEYRSRYRPCSSIPWKPVDLYDVMTSCKFWIVVSVAQDSEWPCVREIEKFAVYSKDKFEFGTIKGSTFGVWLFLENKLMPLLAISDPTTCKVPAVFDIIKGELNKVSPPPNQLCDNYASSPYDVEAITILNQKKLMDSWENWIVLQASPFDANYPATYNEFKTLFQSVQGHIQIWFHAQLSVRTMALRDQQEFALFDHVRHQ